ncbi:MAG TPA: ribonuclease HI [Chloroflexota bacterium]|nr:ribonuclease HI [Chloroflexota bacterium]
MVTEPKHVTIYTDGACIGNPGPGGFGVILLFGTYRREISAGYRQTTNNRMELLAAIAGLRALRERCAVTLYSDSQYLVRMMQGGYPQRWRENGWRRNRKERALNPDLWGELLHRCEQHEVEFVWVRGHTGHLENERCDRLALDAALGSDLQVDEGYERQAEPAQTLL